MTLIPRLWDRRFSLFFSFLFFSFLDNHESRKEKEGEKEKERERERERERKGKRNLLNIGSFNDLTPPMGVINNYLRTICHSTIFAI